MLRKLLSVFHFLIKCYHGASSLVLQQQRLHRNCTCLSRYNWIHPLACFYPSVFRQRCNCACVQAQAYTVFWSLCTTASTEKISAHPRNKHVVQVWPPGGQVQQDVAPQKPTFNYTLLHQKSNWAQLMLMTHNVIVMCQNDQLYRTHRKDYERQVVLLFSGLKTPMVQVQSKAERYKMSAQVYLQFKWSILVSQNWARQMGKAQTAKREKRNYTKYKLRIGNSSSPGSLCPLPQYK